MIETAVETVLPRMVACGAGARTRTLAPVSTVIRDGAATASATVVSPMRAAATGAATRDVFKRKLTLL